MRRRERACCHGDRKQCRLCDLPYHAPSTSRTLGPDIVHGYWSVTMPVWFTKYHQIGRKNLVWPRNSRVDQLAALRELVHGRMQLAQVIASETRMAG